MTTQGATNPINISNHNVEDVEYAERCRATLERDGALVLKNFFTQNAVVQVIEQSAAREQEAYFAQETHNVYLTPDNPDLPSDHVFNRQIVSTKGLIADDQIPENSPLRSVYTNEQFRCFLCRVLEIDEIHSYDDDLSSINVHFASEDQELGWHFDNSAFAVTMLLQAPTSGGVFEYVPNVRDADKGERAYNRVQAVLDGKETVNVLDFAPGDLVLFRGRNAMHRVTPTIGDTTRILAVFAFNDCAGIKLSDSALATFYGRNE